MKRRVARAFIAVIFCGLQFVGSHAHAGDVRHPSSQSTELSASESSPQTFVWDFSLPSKIRAGKTGAIAIEAWSERSGRSSSNFKFYLSKDSRLDIKRDKLIGKLKINLTGPTYGDQNELFYGLVKIPPNTAAGTYFFFLTIDGREKTINGEYFSETLKITKR